MYRTTPRNACRHTRQNRTQRRFVITNSREYGTSLRFHAIKHETFLAYTRRVSKGQSAVGALAAGVWAGDIEAAVGCVDGVFGSLEFADE